MSFFPDKIVPGILHRHFFLILLPLLCRLTFANAALRIMMSRYFYPRARFVAACRYVISEVIARLHQL